eukprot:gene25425-31047_t
MGRQRGKEVAHGMQAANLSGSWDIHRGPRWALERQREPGWLMSRSQGTGVVLVLPV